jgi:UDP-N-acetylglucosamine 2-epimerase (non-hydrolysing)
MPGRDVLFCMGTRPEIIKLAPVIRALEGSPLNPLVVHTGQHNGLAHPHYRFFGIQPDFDIELNRDDSSLSGLFAMLIERLDSVIARAEPAAVVVQGDTSSALAGALAAYYQRIPVAHVEAGLRSHNDYEPWPEEKNRELIARLARWHFVPTARADANLQQEGIPATCRHLVGNTIVDAVRLGIESLEAHAKAGASGPDSAATWARNGAGESRLLLVTAHRRENWGSGIGDIARGVRRIVEQDGGIRVVWPVHANPRVRDTVSRVFSGMAAACAERVFLTAPLSYPELLDVLRQTWLVLTDSGGLQEEAVSLGVPVLVLRSATERPEVVESGAGALIGTRAETIVEWIQDLGRNPDRYRAMHCAANPYGDGFAGRRIAEILARDLSASATDETSLREKKGG